MCGDSEFGGVIFYDAQDRKILEAGHTNTRQKREFELQENERIVGIKSKLIGQPGSPLSPRQDDLQFVIASLE
jgi:hypothetical protein